VLHDFFNWLQHGFGQGKAAYGQSWAEAVAGSLNFWALLEGTHLMTLMLFAGTIFIVDLRLLGVVFRQTPISTISRKVLPLNLVAFAIMIATGLTLFFAKPVDYYHNVWFRAKMVFLLAALINIAIFHLRVQRDERAWDTLAKPPRKVRIAAAISLSAWLMVIMMGRFIPYSWFECGKGQSGFINTVQECAAWPEKGAIAMAEGN
jgi:hypothetical protein